MSHVVRLGRIAAITYSCDIPTARGLCKANKGELFRHEWKTNRPILAANDERTKYHILCKVNFKDGGLMDGFKTGIDDYSGSSPSCEIVPVVPNPGNLDIVGELKLVEMADGEKNYTFNGALLCVSKAGDRLFILDKRDAMKVKGVHVKNNPPAPTPPKVPLPIQNGILLYGSKFCVHCERSRDTAKRAGVPVFYVETTATQGMALAESKSIKAVPFMEKVENGLTVKEHLGEMSVADWKAFA
jgi:hypothetical protein